MRHTLMAGAVLSLFPLAFNPAHATSVDFSSADSGNGAASPSLILSPTSAMSMRRVGELVNLPSAGTQVAAPFDSSLVAAAPVAAEVSSIGAGNRQFGTLGTLSVRC